MSVWLPEVAPYLLGVLALLFVWQLHQIQVAAGRIQAKDLWEGSGIRIFLYVTPDDERTCEACREMHGLVMLPSSAAKKEARPPQKSCTNAAGCRCQLVGLYGGWPRAQLLLRQLKAKSQPESIKLSSEALETFMKPSWQQAPNAAKDRLSMEILQAIQTQGSDASAAFTRYQTVVEKAEEDRDLALVKPAYLRMIDLLERLGRVGEALDLISRFEKEFGDGSQGKAALTHAQLESLALRKTRLLAGNRQLV